MDIIYRLRITAFLTSCFGFKEGVRQADPVILEPVVHVEVETLKSIQKNIDINISRLLK